MKINGGASEDPKNELGRQRCAEAKTTHSYETRKARTTRAGAIRRLRDLDELDYALVQMMDRSMAGQKSNYHH